MTYSLSIATNASFFSSGDGTASRICLTVNSAPSSTWYLNVSFGPMPICVRTWNGMFVARTRRIRSSIARGAGGS